MKHKHDWRLVDVKKGKVTYTIVGDSESSSSVPTGQEPDMATYRCDCGEEKQEEMKAQWS